MREHSCIQCGAAVREETGGEYRLAPLDVVCVGLPVRCCTNEACGDRAVVIPVFGPLHSMIALRLALKPGRLVGNEIDWLARYTAFEGAELYDFNRPWDNSDLIIRLRLAAVLHALTDGSRHESLEDPSRLTEIARRAETEPGVPLSGYAALDGTTWRISNTRPGEDAGGDPPAQENPR